MVYKLVASTVELAGRFIGVIFSFVTLVALGASYVKWLLWAGSGWLW